ncbi:bi-domain-containing oxidoreductase [Nocardioides panaciterrulae]|uniref:Putative dehydrogenase/threonine dehydrogenase-like Zn-dependent dehydrogenase n=1 Tax=Nocardioides panaciterrulae TaxID=661492 RepID=A0A7Y9E8R4_9ACTN|nr:bi-domain-containing oxidoreductase [Nocardioides panaciterrulae]NYD43077.1 putative dehydrogenase/threonine dehydrogenase-like Zn-dependent dehydrogenase [Nocardioides panaciterrulae]
MKQVAQNYKSGELVVLDAPAPTCRPGGVLVRTMYSLISTGTELMKVSEARLSLIGKARARPDQVKKVLDSVAQQGPLAAYQKAMSKLDSYTPLGYSLCGVVVEVGEGVLDLSVGDIVAAAGNEFALHSELNWVPVNLCVRVPDGVPPEQAAFSTVGAIAMQGVRRAEPQLGEVACVIGLGLIGQLVVRLLVAAGVKVVGLDTVAARCRMAEKAGALACASPTAEGVRLVEEVARDNSQGLGCDHVFLAAGGPSNEPVEVAVRLARDRGRVIDIGKTRLDLPWNDYYEKELDVRFSRSYGPGRYDDRYELEGIDYPGGYVRWTERRNLASFLDLVAGGQLDLSALVSSVHDVDEATQVYARLGDGTLEGIGHLLHYPEGDRAAAVDARPSPSALPRATHTVAARRRATGDRLRVGFIGAGSYATSMLLPHLAAQEGVELASVATTRSLSAINAQRKFGFERVSTRADDVLSDPAVDAVFVVTRHHSHAEFVCRALETGKAVFVEKPLALDATQLQRVVDTVERTGNDRLMVGFNRRFAPLVAELTGHLRGSRGPLSMRYLVNAGGMDPKNWYLDPAEGSRFVGEGGHFVDTLSAVVGQDPVAVHSSVHGDDVHSLLVYPDGSTGSIAYVTTGSPRFPKETLDVSGAGANARLDNFRKLSVWGTGRETTRRAWTADKGQRREIAAFVDAVTGGGDMPISIESLLATTRATLAIGGGTSGEVLSP